MRVTRGLVSLVSMTVIVAGSLIGAAPATAAGSFVVTAPADASGNDAVWYTGETKNITWTVDTETGSYTLELWSTGGAAAKLATIGTGSDITAGTFRWTIPTAIGALVVEDAVVKVVPAAGAVATSDAFDLRRSMIAEVNLCDSVPEWPLWWTFCRNAWDLYLSTAGDAQYVYWSSAGVTGALVKIDLVHTGGGITPLSKSTANDGAELVLLPSKLAIDEGFDESYRIRVTPVSPVAVGRDSGSFPVYWGSPVRLDVGHGGVDLTVEAGESVELELRATEVTSGRYKVEAKPATGKATVLYTGAIPEMGSVQWRPTTPGTYQFVGTDLKNKKFTAAPLTKVIVTTNPDLVRQAAPSDTTATLGQPVTLSWDFFDDGADTGANDSRPPVDINVVDASGKATNIAKAFAGVWQGTAPVGHVGPFFPEWVDDYVWRPSAKLAAGTYTIKVNKTGDTATSDQTITLAQPTSLTTEDFASATFEVGERIVVDWTVTEGAEVPVDITLVPTGEGRAIPLAKKLVSPGTSATVTVPPSTPAGTYNLTVTTIDKFGTLAAVLTASEAVTITAPVLTTTVPSTAKNGTQITISWAYADDSALPVKLELLQGAGTKVLAVIAKSAPSTSSGTGSVTWTVPGKLPAAADYVVRATAIGPKPAPSDASGALAVTATTITVDEDALAGGVTIGQTVPLEWAADTGVAQSVTVSLVQGTKVVAKLDAKACDGQRCRRPALAGDQQAQARHRFQDPGHRQCEPRGDRRISRVRHPRQPHDGELAPPRSGLGTGLWGPDPVDQWRDFGRWESTIRGSGSLE